jgi:class 3 adenylate cyclase
MRDDSPIFATIMEARAEGLPATLIDERVWGRHGTTCAMLALDSSGMTRISRAEGIVHFLGRYLQMRHLAEPILEAHGCWAWRSFADNLFAEFPEADPALAAALAIHGALREHKLMLTDTEPYQVAMAIGFGRVLDNGRAGVMGEEMNLAAKLAEDVAEGGETLLTESAHRNLEIHAGLPVTKCRRTLSRMEVTYFSVRP